MNRRALDAIPGSPAASTATRAATNSSASSASSATGPAPRQAGLLGDRLDMTGAAVFIVVMALLPTLLGNSYLTGVLTVAVIYGIWAVSWDFMSGLTGRENFGHALFIGAGAYTAGFMNTVW